MSNDIAKCNDQPATERSCPDPSGSREAAKIKSYGLINSPEHAMRWLERLTPGGSEFRDDPENCFYLLIRERDTRWETIKRQQKRIRELEKLLSENAEDQAPAPTTNL